MALGIFLLPLLALIPSATTAASALPGCPSTCGNVTIPYPFGVGPGCFQAGFEITCKTTNLGLTPFLPRTVVDAAVEVLSLSLQPGAVNVRLPIAWECYNKSGAADNFSAKMKFIRDAVYRPSDAHNQFVVIGCNTVALIQSLEDSNTGDYPYEYYTGCVSFCTDKESVVNGSCSGLGCCQHDIATDLSDISVSFGGYDHSDILEFNPCSYAFLVDKEWFRFSLADLIMDVNTTVPVWLD